MRKRRKAILIAVAAILLLGAVATMAFAQPEESMELVAEELREDRPPWARLADHIRKARKHHRMRLLMDEALADELNITVEELISARQAARVTAIQQAEEEGLISADRAQLLLARTALHEYIQKDQFIADVLELSTEELETAREEGKNLRQLAIELGLDWRTVRENIRATWEENIRKAKADGVINQEQAELLLNNPPKFRPPHPKR